MKKVILSLAIVATLLSCDNEENDTVMTVAPATYSFVRGGESTVFYDGQTTRIQMGNEIGAALQ